MVREANVSGPQTDLERARDHYRAMAEEATKTGDPAARWWAALADELDGYLTPDDAGEGLFG